MEFGDAIRISEPRPEERPDHVKRWPGIQLCHPPT
jgi:hypothetical protein